MLILFFFLETKFGKFKCLIVHFFVSGVFQNFEVYFWSFTKDGKIASPEQILAGKFFFLKNFIFYHPYERYKLLANRTPFI